MHDEKYAQQRFGKAASLGPLVLPKVQGEDRRVVYTITEYDPLLDSSNMTNQEWVRIAEDIKVSGIVFILPSIFQHRTILQTGMCATRVRP